MPVDGVEDVRRLMRALRGVAAADRKPGRYA
jgi:hypothetical protein